MEAVKKILMSPRPAVRALALYLPGVAAALAVAAVSCLLLPEGSFKNADGEDVPLADVQEKEDYHVVEVDGPVTMQIEGKVQFVSSGVTVDSKNTVTTPAGEVSYIVFK